jgi:catechol 2,3-dioxygenase-like lactoylglutathione lyase family enzyme
MVARLLHVILYSRDLGALKAYYRDRVGIGVRDESDGWVELDTGGCTLALHAVAGDAVPGPASAGPREAEVSFRVFNLEAAVAELASRGLEFPAEIQHRAFGKVIHFRDPEGNLVALHEPKQPSVEGLGPRLSAVVLNCRELERTRDFYRDVMGLNERAEQEDWTEFELPGVDFALHPWSSKPKEVAEHGIQPLVFCFHTAALRTWLEDLRGRGVKVIAEPSGELFGLHAEVADPDGHVFVLRQPKEQAPPRPPRREQQELDLFAPPAKAARARAKARKKPAARKLRKAAAERVAGKGAPRRKPPRWRAEKVKAAKLPRRKRPAATGRLRKAERRALRQAKKSQARSSKGRVPKRRAGVRSKIKASLRGRR